MGLFREVTILHKPINRRRLIRLLLAVATFLVPAGCRWPGRQTSDGESGGGGASDRASTRGGMILDPYRLPPHVIPTHYDLRLEPDLTAFSFSGTEIITVTVREATSEIWLNAAELNVLSASIEGPANDRIAAAIEMDEATARCGLRFGRSLGPGEWRLHLSFKGILNDKLRGFYRSRYKDDHGTYHMMAATQFEATDARRAFPCWDEPAYKAVFATTLVIDPELTAVSNTAVLSETMERGKKVVRFKDTIKMSTYLVAFIVGRIEATRPVQAGSTPLRLWAVPGKQHLAGFGQEIAVFSLRFFEDYYDVPYPGDKLDLLAIPDFASGAMENLGAITFRETALLLDDRTATHAERERVADVVAHENAHMWFGDLVTMSWWNGIWLNEAFATFMEMLAVDAWKPEWRRWESFGAGRAAAMSVDGLHNTRPIEYPVRAPRDADAMFDVLTYEKGASILRMLEQHLGPDLFRQGVRGYLRTHAYANADTSDLWTALEKAAGQAVPALMDGWIFRPGYPLVTVTMPSDRTLLLTQQRFTYLRGDEAREVSVGSPQDASPHWHVPIQIRITANGQSTTQRVLLESSDMRLELPDGLESVVVNAGGHGFYRVHYSAELVERLLRKTEHLEGIERFNLVSDSWATAVTGLIPLADYLELTARFRGTRDKNIWGVIIDSLQTLYRLVVAEERPMLEALVRDRLGMAMAELGWTPRTEEGELIRQLRGDLLRAQGTIGNDSAVQAKAMELYGEHKRAASAGSASRLDPNVLAAIVGILAFSGDEARYAEFFQAFQSASTPQDERRYLFALAAFRQDSLHEKTLARTLNGEIRTQDAPFIVSVMLTNVYARERTWRFVKANWDSMEQLFPKNGLRRMCGGVVGLSTPELECDVRQFFADRKIDLGGKTLAQYLEQLRIAVTMRERERPGLRQYLTQRMPAS